MAPRGPRTGARISVTQASEWLTQASVPLTEAPIGQTEHPVARTGSSLMGEGCIGPADGVVSHG